MKGKHMEKGSSNKKKLIDRLGAEDIPTNYKKVKITQNGGTTLVIDIKPFDRKDSSKELCILKKGKDFFEVPAHYDQIKGIVNEEHGAVSLRILDFLVTNYSKKHSVSYMYDGQFISLFALYKSALRAYSKRSFDAFCRRERILFKLDSQPTPILTTHAQINFLMWCVTNNVIQYAKEHKAGIEKEMAICAKSRKSMIAPRAPNVTVTISSTI